ncbi:hypothetical protein [Rhizobium arsenicireducens]
MEDVKIVDQLLRQALERVRRERRTLLAYLIVMAIEENVSRLGKTVDYSATQ